jgi:hypothetical protein
MAMVKVEAQNFKSSIFKLLDFYYGSAHKGIMINLYMYSCLPAGSKHRTRVVANHRCKTVFVVVRDRLQRWIHSRYEDTWLCRSNKVTLEALLEQNRH